MKIKHLFIVFVLSLVFTAVLAADLSGTTPTEREDNSPLGLSEIAGFRIYCGMGQGDYQDMMYFPGATLPDTVWNVDSLNRPDGTSYCVITTLDIDGRESLYSNEVTVIVDTKARPKPPTIAPNQVIRLISTVP